MVLKSLVCFAVLCFTLIEAKRNLFQPRAVAKKSLARSASDLYNCYYDGQIYFENFSRNFRQSSYNCRDSYAYSLENKRYIVVDLTNINVACNGFDDIELWDHNGQEFKYCESTRPSSVTFIAERSTWVGFSRVGIVSYSIRVRFRNTKPTTVVTQAPFTQAPFTQPPVTQAPPTNAQCGVQAISPKNENSLTKIVGGEIVTQNSWPWMVSFKKNGGFFCGASLIDNQWLLTAAHCQQTVSGLVAHLGDHNIYNNNDNGEEAISVSKWISHPNYDNNRLTNDIALVKLSRSVTLSNKIQKICLATQEPSYGQNGVVTGWGTTQADGNGVVSQFLRQVGVPVNRDTDCGYGNLPDTQICAGTNTVNNEKDSCQGDSGGPFVIKTGGVYYQVGVVSYGVACGGNGVYTNVAKYSNWISTTMQSN